MVIDRRYERLERRALEGELNRWGNWIERHSHFEGFPGMNVIVGFLMGRGGGRPRDRILCLEMPVEVYAVHARVMTLQEELQDALALYYITRLSENGTLMTIEFRCEKVGISVKTLQRRLRRARRRLMGLEDENDACTTVLCQVHSVAS